MPLHLLWGTGNHQGVCTVQGEHEYHDGSFFLLVVFTTGAPAFAQASKVHSAPPISASLPRKPEPQPGDDIDTLLSPEEFKKLQLEVERLGAWECRAPWCPCWHSWHLGPPADPPTLHSPTQVVAPWTRSSARSGTRS